MTADESIEKLVEALLGVRGTPHDPAGSARLVPFSDSSVMPGAYSAAESISPAGRAVPVSSSVQVQSRAELPGLPSLSDDIERLIRQNRAPVQQDFSSPLVARTQEGSDGSALASAGKTLALATGIGPLATGLLKLFGGGNDAAESSPERDLWARPTRLDVEAALDAQGNLQPFSYSSQGNIRVPSSQTERSPASLPPIQVNVSAMDSRSFLEHSDDIARAVREALLRSSALSDVIAEF